MGEYNVTVEYRNQTKNAHVLKVTFHDFGMFIDGWRLMQGDKGWWFQAPSRPHGPKNWKPTVEFVKVDNSFWSWLEAEAISVVERETRSVAEPAANGKDGIVPMPPDNVLDDPELFDAFLGKNIDQTLPGTDVPRTVKGDDPWKNS